MITLGLHDLPFLANLFGAACGVNIMNGGGSTFDCYDVGDYTATQLPLAGSGIGQWVYSDNPFGSPYGDSFDPYTVGTPGPTDLNAGLHIGTWMFGYNYSPATDSNVVEWLKADTIIASDLDFIATWPATIGNDGTATAGREPQYKTAQQNGLPAVRFSLATLARYMTVATFGTIAQPFEVWVVFRLENQATTVVPFDGTTVLAEFYNVATPRYGMAAPTVATSGIVSNASWHIARVVFNGAASSITIDDGTPAVLNAGTNSLVGLRLGNALTIQETFGACLLGEIFVSDTINTDTSGRWGYLRGQWATY